MVALMVLCGHVISQAWALERHDRDPGKHAGTAEGPYSSGSRPDPDIWALIFAYYTLLIHALVFAFPLRACWSVWSITRSLKRAARRAALEGFKTTSRRRRASIASTSSSETIMSNSVVSDSQGGCSSTASEANGSERDVCTDAADAPYNSVIHVIVIPNYKEELDTLKETLQVLASHPQARCSYDVSMPLVPSAR